MPYQSIFSEHLFRGKTIIVTGGGSGIGRCTAHELAHLGASLSLIGRRLERLTSVRDEIIDACGAQAEVSTFSCDIREELQVTETVAKVLDRHGRIDGLVNNAGGQFPAPLASISAKGWDTVVRNNLTGGFLFARECYKQWMEQHSSDDNLSIVNIIADMWHGMPGMGHSGAARAGMLNFTETASLEWAPVRVNAIAPGWIASSGMDTYPEPMRTQIRSLHRNVPLHRLGTESEVAAAIVFLLSPGAAFISGSCLRVDGAAPNAKRVWPVVGNGHRNRAFNAFHLATLPQVLNSDSDT